MAFHGNTWQDLVCELLWTLYHRKWLCDFLQDGTSPLLSTLTQVNMRLTTGTVSTPLEPNIKTPGLGKNSKIRPKVFKFPLGWFHEELSGISTSLPVGKDADPSNINKKNTNECRPRHQQKSLSRILHLVTWHFLVIGLVVIKPNSFSFTLTSVTCRSSRNHVALPPSRGKRLTASIFCVVF